jgi:O-succinylbenzoic acid--CoA ligase
MDLPREPRGSDLLAERVTATPTATALIHAEDGDQWTYAELDEAVERTAGRLAAFGIGEGDRIGLLAENRPVFVRLLYATMRIGAVLVPMDPSRSTGKLTALLEQAGLTALFCTSSTSDDTVAAATEATIESTEPLPVVTIDADHSMTTLADREPAEVDRVEPTVETVRLVLFTSGTTGTPKSVRLTVGNLRASAIASGLRLGVDPADRWLAPLPAYHMGGLAPHLRSTLYGTTAILQPAFDAQRTLDTIETYDATCLSLVPTALRRLLDAGGDEIPDLRFVLCGGAPTPSDLVERCEQAGLPVCPTYGMTETTSQIATPTPEEAREYTDTVGRPLLWTDITILDDDGGTPVPTGDRGEIVVDGPTVTPGYDDPDATVEAFGEHGFLTGDVGYRDQAGRLWVTGRTDDAIVTGGENVYPGPIAEALRSHSAVLDAAVVGLEDPEWGERVAALVVPDVPDSDGLDRAELRAVVREQRPDHEVPKTIATTRQLPRTPSGTLDRPTIRSKLDEPRDESA